MELTGRLLIGERWTDGDTPFRATSPIDGALMDTAFHSASTGQVADACALAAKAADAYASLPLEQRAAFLSMAADEILALGDALIERAHKETGLPVARLQGERGRTMGQLKLFADEILDGGWMDLRIDPALPDRQPLPRAAHAMMNVPLGPVAVFGASNFPLAFSVAGGDTASALAAGCPVVVKAHPAHPGTSEMVAAAILKAAKTTGMPNGVFSLLHGQSHQLGLALVQNPDIMAVGFTGSRQGGIALMTAAAQRAVPIPVFAEMSAVNPVVLLPGALDADPEGLARAFVGSLTMGAGQFCTNPGLVLAVKSPALDTFKRVAAATAQEAAAQTMLTSGIHQGYCAGVAGLSGRSDTVKLAGGAETGVTNGAVAAFFETGAESFTGTDARAHEVFGPSSVLVSHDRAEELATTLSRLDGQLTASLHFAESDIPLARSLTPVLQSRAGRLIANGWPTGVEVCHAMMHGGPFPATSDGRTTSVGTRAIERFLRPVCYQGFPDSLLPQALRADALGGKLRRVDGRWLTA